jgi:flagellar protein FlbD
MIRLTRLNGSEVYVNALLIEKIEATPDTVITLTTGNRLIVREKPEQITSQAIDYLQRLPHASDPGVNRGLTPAQWARINGRRSR